MQYLCIIFSVVGMKVAEDVSYLFLIGGVFVVVGEEGIEGEVAADAGQPLVAARVHACALHSRKSAPV